MIKTLIKRDLFGNEYREEEEIPSLFPWVQDYEEDENTF